MPWSIAFGIGINLVFVLTITVMSMLASEKVTEVAIVGWGEAIGGWAFLLGSVFGVLAMLTSYWSVSYALSVILQERLNWGYRLSWLTATAPTILIAIQDLGGFLEFIRVAGGAMAVLVAILIVPALRISRKRGAATEEAFNLGSWGGEVFQLIAVIAYLAMAAGSMVPVR